FVSIGGHGAYVRAHGRAAVAAGFEPHIFSVAHRAETRVTDFGVLHREACPLWPEQTWMPPGHVPSLVLGIGRFARAHVLTSALVHAFGMWGAAGVVVKRRLQRHGVQATTVVSAYATYANETRATVRGMGTGYSWRARLNHRMIYEWTRYVVDPLERWGYTN